MRLVSQKAALEAANRGQPGVGEELSADSHVTQIELLRSCGNRTETRAVAQFLLTRSSSNCRI